MNFLRIKKYCQWLLITTLGSYGAISSHAATVDLLVLYDSYSKNYFNGDPQTAMIDWVNQMNAAYKDSQVDIQLRLVGVRPNEDAGANQDAVLNNLKASSAMTKLRDQLGADFVSQLHQTGNCGVGFVAVNKDWAWNVLSPNCGPMTMIHELGHNMGLQHSRRQGDTKGTLYDYALGYGMDNLFSTIMAYESVFNTTRVNRFSNPNLLCRGLPCGKPVGAADQAYAALALQNVRNDVASFRPSATPGGSILLRARGTKGDEHVNLTVAGNVVASWILSTSAQNYTYTGNASGAIQVQFDNDATGRDVIVDYLQVNGETRQAENMSYNTAFWANGKCGGGGYSESMNCNGVIGFGNTYDCFSGSCNSSIMDITIQAENYTDSHYVQTENTSDIGNGQNVGWIDTGDWMSYANITFPISGTYTVEYRVASANGGGRLALDLNAGAIPLGSLDIRSTGGWQTWITLSHTITVNAGTYNLGVYAETGGWNINWIHIKR